MKVGTDAMMLGALIDCEKCKIALDVGTGTGVLALMLAQKNKEINCTGIDIDEPSILEAQQNFLKSKWSDRLHAIHGDFLSMYFDAFFDLIVSNPPYYTSTLENNDTRKAKSRHVASLPIDQFVRKVSSLLTNDGNFYIIVPFSDQHIWISEAEKSDLILVKNIEISGKESHPPIRCVLCFSKVYRELEEEAIFIRKTNGEYSNGLPRYYN